MSYSTFVIRTQHSEDVISYNKPITITVKSAESVKIKELNPQSKPDHVY